MATSLLAVGHTAASSAEQTLGEDDRARLILTPASGQRLTMQSNAIVELKSANGAWINVGTLMPYSGPVGLAADLIGPCTYRVTRPILAPEHACGVDLA